MEGGEERDLSQQKVKEYVRDVVDHLGPFIKYLFTMFLQYDMIQFWSSRYRS